MLSIGDVQVYVSDFPKALRFWADGLRLRITERDVGEHAAFARLELGEDEPSVRLISADAAWEPGTRPPHGSRPTICFDITTDAFDETLIRLLEHGGQQAGEIETYNELRMITVADPDGNTFDLIELPADPQ